MNSDDFKNTLICGKCHSGKYIKKTIFDGEIIFYCEKCGKDTHKLLVKARNVIDNE